MSNISSQYMIPAANKQQVSFNSEDVSSEMNSLNRLCRDIYNAIHHLFTGSKRPDVEQHLRVFVNAKNDSYARSEAFAKLVMLAAPDCLTEEIPASVSAVYSISQQSTGEKVSYTLKMKPVFVQQKNGNNQNQNASGLEYELKFSDEDPLGLDLDSECAKVILAMCAGAGAAKAVSTKDGPVFNKALDIISNPSGHTIPNNEDFTLKEEPHSTAALTSTKKVTNKSTQKKINAEINKAKFILDGPKLQDESGILSQETEKAIRTVLVHIGSKSSLSSDDDMYCRKACLQALYFLGLNYSHFDADSKEQSKARYADLIGLVSNFMNKNKHLFAPDEIDAIKTTKPTDIKTTKPTDTN